MNTFYFAPMNLSEYFSNVPIQADIDALSDPSLSYEEHRDDVNQLVLNTVLKYIAEYLEANPQDVREIRNKFKEALAITEGEGELLVKQTLLDLMGVGIRIHKSDLMALQCLADVRSTAAIFKEVAFSDRFQKEGNYLGIDLGSGTGILSLAMGIAARRAEVVDTLIVGLEIQEKAVVRSRRALERILGNREVLIRNANVLSRGLFHQFEGLPLHAWVSETISIGTPPLGLNGDKLTVLESSKRSRQESMEIVSMSRGTDPFVDILANTLSERPQIVNDVKEGRTAMFPDFFNGNYMPDHEASTLKLRTAKDKRHQLISHVGREFGDYEDLGLSHRRWNEEVKADDFTSQMSSLMKF